MNIDHVDGQVRVKTILHKFSLIIIWWLVAGSQLLYSYAAVNFEV